MSRSRSTSAALAVLVFLGVLTGVAPSHAAPPPAGPVRILFTGDSITQGFHGDYSWRYRLWREFRRQAVAVDFVGSRATPFVKSGFTSAAYIDPNFDRSHFAQGGTLLQHQAGRIGQELRSQTPDIIVLFCGVNDLRHGATPAQTDRYLRAWIDAARAAKPTVRIVISPVLNATDAQRPWLAQRIAQYNGLAKATVAELSNPSASITLADTARGWSVPAHTYDDLHPNPTGETLIAQRLAETFNKLGVLPRAGALIRYTSWNRQPRVRVVVKGRRAVLSWDGQAITGVRLWMQRAGKAPTFPATIRRGSTMTTGVLARRSTYEFRVQMIRSRMLTPLGPGTRVWVARAHRR